jgi:tetratricopeptide (TPR) repeat protein
MRGNAKTSTASKAAKATKASQERAGKPRRPPVDPAPVAAFEPSLTVVFVAFAALTLLVYLPLITGPTSQVWDDSGHITKQSLRSLEGLWKIWFEVGATQQYYPVVHSAFWIQAQLWGDSLAGYHAVNVLLHACSATLIVATLRRLSVSGALLAGLLFALHPVEVESVAWISELKNTLSGVFFFAAALIYLRFDDTRARARYFGALGLYVLAVLSKSVTATLPIGLLVLLWYRRGGLDWKRDALPLAPFLALGVLGGAVTVWFEHSIIGAEGEVFELSLVERALVAGRAVWFYAASLAWPASLSFNYPRWVVSQAVWWQYLFPAGVVAVILVLWRFRARGALAAVLVFCVTVAPALGFVNVYPFKFSFVADHFQYHASAALLALAAAAIVAALRRIASHRGVLVAAIAALGLALGMTARAHAVHYSNAETLYRATIAANPDSWLSHNNLAAILLAGPLAGVREAVEHARMTVQRNPRYSEGRYNLAMGLHRLGDHAGAAAEYRALLTSVDARDIPRPRLAEVRYGLGSALRATGQLAEAIPELEQSVSLNPGNAETQGELGRAYAEAGRPDAALAHFNRAAALAPDAPSHRANLGTALLQLHRPADAIAALTEAIRLDPSLADTYVNLGVAYATIGDFPRAAGAYREALRLRPSDSQTRSALTAVLQRIK